MYGAVIGDLAGSIYEYDQFDCNASKKVVPRGIINRDAFYSDDTILTMAILDAYLNNKDFYNYIKKYIRDYNNDLPSITPYFKTVFSPNIIKWSKTSTYGKSTGNGAMMRISPIGYLANSEAEVFKYAYQATKPSHNTAEGINCATTIALIIYYLRNGMTREEVFHKLRINVKYEPFTKFNTTCNETIGNCLVALKEASSFEDAIYRTIKMGGDTDTNACIVGSMAESVFGIPEYLIAEADEKIPDEFKLLLKKGYNKMSNK